jgi:hypothetical protein
MPRKVEGGEWPSLRFRYPATLHAQVLEVLEALETADDATRHRGALSDVVLQLTEAGLDWYFVKAVRDAKVEYVAEQTTKVGLSSIRKVMGPVVRRVIGGMNHEQLRSAGGHIRGLMG